MGGVGDPGWSSHLREGGSDPHLVQLYRDEPFLVRAVSTWAGQALVGGGAAVLVGTPEHCAAVLGALTKDGFDVAEVEAEARLHVLDAERTLDRFYHDGKPDVEAFHDVVTEAVGRVRADDPTREVRAWGEMVNLLCERGDLRGAMMLEDLWNAVLGQEHLRLLCSYRGDPFDSTLYARKLRAVTHGHSRLLSVEDEGFLEASVQVAMRQVCGFAEADALRASLGARALGGLDLAMPAGQRLLVNLHHVLPDYGRKVIERAGAHYRAVVS